MHTFFHGWRRKAGVVALGLACVVATGLVRSNILKGGQFVYTEDIIRLVRNEQSSESIVSRDGVVTWVRLDRQTGRHRDDTQPHTLATFRTAFAGFPREQFITPDGAGIRRLVIPYWSLVLLLTLLSAYLILWKPRKRA